MRYRVHMQARWPTLFETLGGAIGFIRSINPLWYILEEDTELGWKLLVSSEMSRVRTAHALDEGISEDEL